MPVPCRELAREAPAVEDPSAPGDAIAELPQLGEGVRGEDEIVPGARRHDRLGEGLEIATRDGAGMGHQRGRGGDLSGTGCALGGRVPGRGGPHGLADGIEGQAEASGKAVDINGGWVDAGHAETVPPPRLAREGVGLAEADADGRRRPVGLEPAARSGCHDHVSGA